MPAFSFARAGALALLLTAALGFAFAAPALAAQPAIDYSSADYWAFADRRAADVESLWRADLGRYLPRDGGVDVRLNSSLLSVHAVAALTAHTGASRQDARAVALVRALTSYPAYIAGPVAAGGAGHAHAPGWSASTQRPGKQHVAIDPMVAEALAYAWRARDAIGLDAELAATIQREIFDTARGAFFAYPAIRQNQFSWHATMTVLAAQVTGDTSILEDYRLQLARFTRNIRRAAPGGSTNLNAGLGLHYLPGNPAGQGGNRTATSEYANLVFSGLMHYDWAIANGMRALSAGEEALLRAWGQRILFGDWTHAGYLNWDSALGFRRWHLLRYWAFAQSGLDTLLTQRRLAFGPSQQAWAKYVNDRALDTYERWAGAQPERMLPAVGWGIYNEAQSPGSDPHLISARFAAHAARLALLNVGSVRAQRPPSYYALDPDIRRLAVSTPHYSAALTQPNPNAAYGGMEFARLYNAASEPVSGTGGSGASAFGLQFKAGGHVRLDTQPGAAAALTPPLRLTAGGRRARARGAFRTLTSRATLRNAWARVRVKHRFTARTITVTRTVHANRDGVVTVRLPVWGERANFHVLRRPGAGRASARRGVIARAANGGYSARFVTLPRRATITVGSVPAQVSSPQVRRVATIRFALRAGQSATVAIRLTPYG